jgi:hypothetical protein
MAKDPQKIIIDIANSAKTEEGKSRCLDTELCYNGYAEPGYTDPKSGVIAFNNWNSIDRWNPENTKSEKIDDAPSRLAAALEEAGVEIEWSDEWACCSDCGKAVRTSPNSYGWQRSYIETGCDVLCESCVEPEEHLKDLEGDNQRCLTLTSIDPAEHGYVKLEGDFENGYHPGQDADPKVIGKSLRKMGIKRYLFVLDGTGQFDLSFSVWVHKDEWSEEREHQWRTAKKDGPSPSEAMKKALQSVPPVEVKKEGNTITVHKINAETGEVTTKEITPRDFVEGRALDD